MKNCHFQVRESKRETFEDRGIHTSTDHYLKKMPEICDFFLSQSLKNGHRSRNSYCKRSDWRWDLLSCHSMILRGENGRILELPDLLLVDLGEGPNDRKYPRLIGVLRQGKMNQSGELEYAGMLRHKDPRRCPINALAMYMFERYLISFSKNRFHQSHTQISSVKRTGTISKSKYPITKTLRS